MDNEKKTRGSTDRQEEGDEGGTTRVKEGEKEDFADPLAFPSSHAISPSKGTAGHALASPGRESNRLIAESSSRREDCDCESVTVALQEERLLLTSGRRRETRGCVTRSSPHKRGRREREAPRVPAPVHATSERRRLYQRETSSYHLLSVRDRPSRCLPDSGHGRGSESC